MRRLQMFIPEPLLRALRAIAKKRDVSVSELIRQAIQEFIDRHKA
jgi:metal-responsive CopG/Arc/MetJ family transcriptional regulator